MNNYSINKIKNTSITTINNYISLADLKKPRVLIVFKKLNYFVSKCFLVSRHMEKKQLINSNSAPEVLHVLLNVSTYTCCTCGPWEPNKNPPCT